MALRVSPEKKEEKERVARALLRATLRLSAEHGFASLGLREVARAAEIAPTSFYRHFADMEQLGLSLIEQLVGEMVLEWTAGARAASEDSGSVVGAIFRLAFESVTKDPELMRFIVAERVGAFPTLRRAIAEKLAPISSIFLDVFPAESKVGDAEAWSATAEGAVVLLLEACAQALDGGPGELPALRARSLRQVRLMVAGARGA